MKKWLSAGEVTRCRERESQNRGSAIPAKTRGSVVEARDDVIEGNRRPK